jgi:hypothetical protein
MQVSSAILRNQGSQNPVFLFLVEAGETNQADCLSRLGPWYGNLRRPSGRVCFVEKL